MLLNLLLEGAEQLVCHTRMTQPLGHSIDKTMIAHFQNLAEVSQPHLTLL